MRPGRAGQDGPLVGPRSATAPREFGAGEQERAYRHLVDWLYRQRDIDPATDVEAIAFIVTGAITQYEVMSELNDAPFGIDQERYLAAVADLAATSLTR